MWNAVPHACDSAQDLGDSTSVNEAEKFLAKLPGRNDARERAATLCCLVGVMPDSSQLGRDEIERRDIRR